MTPPVAERSPVLRRTPRQARSRRLVEHVLDTADRLLSAEGVAALTTTRIAHEAGVSVGALYGYFPDRDAIVAALALHYMDEFEELMAALVEQAEARRWDDPVGTLIDAFAGRYRAEPGYRALWLDRHLTPALLDADRRNKHALAAGVARALLAQGYRAPEERLERMCRAAVLTADALLQEAFRSDPEGDPALLDETKCILRGYLEVVDAPEGGGGKG